jgi:septal ring factor EnvC (AmiA/AmiB activator)
VASSAQWTPGQIQRKIDRNHSLIGGHKARERALTAAGRVVLVQSAAVSGGYGNFVCVLGASVGKGEVIGYVGCAGRCFGDHLHFETRMNGAVVNPMNFL